MAQCTVDDVMESIDAWTVLDVNKLVKGLEEKYGISAAPAMAVGAAAAAPGAAGAADGGGEEKTEFSVVLVSAGNKIQVIKAVRELTGLGLKEAKDLVEAAPKPVKSGLTKEQAEEMKKKITEAGGAAEVK